MATGKVGGRGCLEGGREEEMGTSVLVSTIKVKGKNQTMCWISYTYYFTYIQKSLMRQMLADEQTEPGN